MTFYIFSIDGNIGSGKSTLIKKLKNELSSINNLKIIYLQEPVDDWKNIKDENGINLIENYYKNQEKWGFSFQITTLISRIALLKNLKESNIVIITERSISSDKNVFCNMLYNNKIINTLDYNIYLKWYNEFIKDYPITGFIYVKTTPEKAYERVLKRKRVEEDGVPLDYLKECNDYHDNWLMNEKNIKILDGNIDMKDDELSNKWLNSIKTFIKSYIPDEIQFDNDWLKNNPYF